jgi:hypothetical protein
MKPMPAPIIHNVVSIAVFVGQPISSVPIPMRDGTAAAIIGLLAAVPTVIVVILIAVSTVIVRATLIPILASIARMTPIAIPALIVGAAVILGTTCRGRMPFLGEYSHRCSG